MNLWKDLNSDDKAIQHKYIFKFLKIIGLFSLGCIILGIAQHLDETSQSEDNALQFGDPVEVLSCPSKVSRAYAVNGKVYSDGAKMFLYEGTKGRIAKIDGGQVEITIDVPGGKINVSTLYSCLKRTKGKNPYRRHIWD